MHLFSNGNALTTNLKFSTRRFWFCCREKSYEKNLNQVFHFGPLQLQPKFLKKNQYERFYYTTISGTWTFSVGNKTSLKFNKPVYSKFCNSHSICRFVGGNTVSEPACAYSSPHMPTNKWIKLRGKENKQTHRVYPNFELMANESHWVTALLGHLWFPFFLIWWSSGREGEGKGVKQ